MSILFASDDGWIVSHLDYLNKIYENVEVEGNIKRLKFNENFFKINSQYLRQNQIESGSVMDKDQRPPRKKMKKESQPPPQNIHQEQIEFVKTIGGKIIEDASKLQILREMAVNYNEEARLASKNFYLNEFSTNGHFCGSNSKGMAVTAEYSNEKYVFPENSHFYSYDIRNINKEFQINDNFDLIVLDPPWWNKSIRRKKIKFKEGSYKMLYNEEIAKIPIKQLLNPGGIVAMWCTNNATQMKSIFEEIFPAWGITMMGKWYWLKITQNGEPICDFDPSHGKQPYEQIIFGTRNPDRLPNFPQKKIIVSVPSAVHSHKPPLTEVLNRYLPQNPKCMEIFARYLLPNWTSCGLEVLKFQHLSLFTVIDQGEASKDLD